MNIKAGENKRKALEMYGRGCADDEIAATLDVSERTVRRYLKGLRGKQDVTPTVIDKPHYRVKAGHYVFPDEVDRYNPFKGIDGTILVLPDMHDSPKKNKKRFYMAGRYAAQHKFEYIISIGDFLDLESLCSHVKPHTQTARQKPLFMEEIESGAEALQEFTRGLKSLGEGYNPKLIITLGNHEHRAWLWEEEHPEQRNMKTSQVINLFTSFGFEVHPFGRHITVLNVDFTHIPKSIMGKPLGGQMVANTVANKSIRDTVFGHTHKFNIVTGVKTGDNNKITVVEVGCGLDMYEIEDYAKLSMTGWWWGIVGLEIHDGRIQDVNAVSMKRLERENGA